MLKIGTSKTGSVVNCPRCSKSVVVPPQTSPQAELLYQIIKNKRAADASAPQPANIPTPPETEPAFPEADGDDLDWDADLNRWLDELRRTIPAHHRKPYPAPPMPTASPAAAEEITLLALQKRYQSTVTLLYLSSVVAFFIGIVVGFSIFALFQPFPTPSSPLPVGATSVHEVAGTLFYRNHNGDRLADADAVVICLPKDRLPTPLFSCYGLRPDDTLNNDAVQLIRELGGMYTRADAHGSFTLPYREGQHYVVLLISAHQKRTGDVLLPSVLQELRRYFRDPELFNEHALHVDEYEWSGGKNSLRYAFEFER